MSEDGREAKYDFCRFHALALATPKQRNNYRITYSEIVWPELDEEINLEGMFYDNGLCTLTPNEDSVVYLPQMESDMVAEP